MPDISKAEKIRWASGDVMDAETRMTEQVEHTVSRLRKLANEVEGKTSAADIVHALTWGFANLDLDAIVRAEKDVSTTVRRLAVLEAGS